jgi:small subunit ribosomal protein S13
MSEINYIVRLVGKDLDGTKRVSESLRGLKGISHRVGEIAANKFCKEQKVSRETKLGELTNEQVKKLEEIIAAPEKNGVPKWALNRQRDYDTGDDKHLTMNDLDFQLRTDSQRLAEMKSYRGLRRMWGLPVRGQKTRGTHRGKGGTVGVTKKDNKKK